MITHKYIPFKPHVHKKIEFKVIDLCVISYPRVHTNTKKKRFLGKDDLSHNKMNEGTLMEILD